MSDVRLIDANVLTRWLEMVLSNANPLDRKARADFSEVLARVKTLPDIDAVPVVRCRECKHWSGRNDKPGEVTAIGYCNHPNHHIMPLRADWFCADGAKMDGGAEE
jgi:hypothetical protein